MARTWRTYSSDRWRRLDQYERSIVESSNEQMRLAIDDESKGVEVVNRFLDCMRNDLQRKHGPKKFLDVTREGEPNFCEVDDGNQSTDDEDNATLTPDTRLPRLEREDIEAA